MSHPLKKIELIPVKAGMIQISMWEWREPEGAFRLTRQRVTSMRSHALRLVETWAFE